MTNRPMLVLGTLTAASLLALSSVQCNHARCEDLRDQLYANKLAWQPCYQDSDCIKVFGNPRDCTGILACDFAVNRAYRVEVERRVASLPEDTVDCMQCAAPNCVSGDVVWCEPTSQKCVLTAGLNDAGVPSMVTANDGSPEEPLGTGGQASTANGAQAGANGSS